MAFNTEGTLPTYKRSGAFSFLGFHCLYMMFLGYLDVNYAKILKVGFPLYEHLGSKTPLCLEEHTTQYGMGWYKVFFKVLIW